PDFLGTTFWYYCGDVPHLQGFPRWDDAVLLDLTNYSQLWNSPSANSEAISRIRGWLEQAGESRFQLISEDWDPLPPLHYGLRVRKLRHEIAASFDEGPALGYFRGRLESVHAATWIGRSSGGSR